MDVTPFMSNVIQNVCTFDALLTSHQMGWSVVPLQILMVPILMEAAATPCHLEFVQYLTERSLHIQQSIQVSNATPAPAPVPCSVGVDLKSEQENPSSSRPKTSDPDSPEIHPTPHSKPPVMPSKPPMMPTKPETMLSKTPGATPTKPEATPLKTLDASLRPPATPKKCNLMPQKAIPCGSGNSAKDIMDRVTAKYRSGMSPQYSNVLVLLTSGKSSQAVAPKHTDLITPTGGDHAYVRPTRSDSNSDHKKAEPPNKRAKRDPGSRPEAADAGSCGSKKKSSKKNSKKMPKSKKTITSDSDSSESENLCGKLHSQPTKRLKNANAGVLTSGRLICQVCNLTGSGKESSQRVLLHMITRTILITFNRYYATMSLLAWVYITSLTFWNSTVRTPAPLGESDMRLWRCCQVRPWGKAEPHPCSL